MTTGNATAPFRLDGKTAVVTGAAAGIGRAIAQAFAAHGATVHILDINLAQAEAVAKEINGNGGGVAAHAHACDVSDLSSVDKTFSDIIRAGRIDILVNNAGIAHVGNVENTPDTDFDKILRVNVKSVYYCTQAVVGHMKEKGGGVILNMASVSATVGLSDRFAYSMSKGAVRAMTLSVAKDYLPFNIRCNCISPARVHTPFVDGFLRKNYPDRQKEMFEALSKTQPIGRMGQPDEVANLALFLCSQQAAFITGSDYPIDGGFLNLHG